MKTICIMCPMGCPLEIDDINGNVQVTGNTCKRGQVYGVEEFTHPKRTITTLVKREGGGVVSVKTSGAVDKEKMFVITAEIGKIIAPKNAKIGDIVCSNVFGQGVDVVITGVPD